MALQFVKQYSLTEALAHKVHDFSSDTLKIAFTNTAPNLAWTQLSDLTEIAYTNFPSDRTVVVASSSQTAGQYSLFLTDKQWTATGTVAAFRYIYIYNDDATNDELIGYIDWGAEVNLIVDNIFKLDFDGVNGLFTIG